MTQEQFYNRYQFDIKNDKIGGGAFGKVYKAYDAVRNRYVALKVAEVMTVGDKTLSLQDELDAIAHLPDHINIAHYEDVYKFETKQGEFDYAIMQFYPDGSLSNVLEHKKLSQAHKEEIAIGILEGLAFLHDHKVTHRDLKPANILIVNHNNQYIPKIADFGLSKKADTHQSRFTNSFGGGTLAYSSPEQLKGQELRFNTDLWSWASMTYELFTGKRLFDTAPQAGTAERENIIYRQILNRNVDEALDTIPDKWRKALSTCLERDPDKRAKSADEIKEILGIKTSPQQDTDLSLHDKSKKVLNDTHSVNDKTIVRQTVVNEVAKPKSPTRVKHVAPPKKSKIPMYIVGGLALVAALFFGSRLFSDKQPSIDKQELAFKQLDKTDILSLQEFVNTFKTGTYVQEVKDILTKFTYIPCQENSGRWGYLDSQFNIKIPFKYSNAKPFSGGLAPVESDGRWGYINESGTEVVGPQYRIALPFSEGMAMVGDDNYIGFINQDGSLSIPMEYDAGSSFREGLAVVSKEGKYGFIDNQGTLKIPYQYTDAMDFNEGLAAVEQNGKWGFVSLDGTVTIPHKYDEIGYFNNGIARVKINTLWGAIDKSGNYVIEPRYNYFEEFNNGLAKIGIGDLSPVYGYIDRTGSLAISAQYQKATSFSKDAAAVMKGGKWGFIDREGKYIISPKYDSATYFSDGISLVSKNYKYGYVNNSGVEIVSPRYESAEGFKNNFGQALYNGNYYYINTSGNLFKK